MNSLGFPFRSTGVSVWSSLPGSKGPPCWRHTPSTFPLQIPVCSCVRRSLFGGGGVRGGGVFFGGWGGLGKTPIWWFFFFLGGGVFGGLPSFAKKTPEFPDWRRLRESPPFLLLSFQNHVVTRGGLFSSRVFFPPFQAPPPPVTVGCLMFPCT